MPCGKTISPLPKLRTSAPDASNLSTVSRSELRHVFAPHRSATQIERPSLSISTALVDPHVRPAGILKRLAMVSYGFGGSLTGAGEPCAKATVARNSAEIVNSVDRVMSYSSRNGGCGDNGLTRGTEERRSKWHNSVRSPFI